MQLGPAIILIGISVIVGIFVQYLVIRAAVKSALWTHHYRLNAPQPAANPPQTPLSPPTDSE